ncbi:hypothetical protein MARA_33880 [Mycolicibacterium arabiense]|uniref:Asp23/Gls24 family envelope stress response protein n=1 Tax=Mycolicibacterium arabiense TaxID=1286181 RepID=A0A7I7S0C9_9MYCO|nr:Asp23/Gls24 family envelope stress response protein [Mycolicibacterium arabiense]MCV7371224.1 Asp23/Gls24 family envelope stress response protein [Mycolicibacterium arabiense]BBY49920.1 hypothetical protein MARA_33880 [Mycolicibacterium arabiense]
MADTGAAAEAPALADDAGERGSLTVRDRAVERLVIAAALDCDGVDRRSTGVDRITGRELPRADVVVSGDHVRAAVAVAVEWRRPLAETSSAVAQSVTHALATMSGLVVDGVDVHVATVLPPGAGTPKRRVS